MKTELFTDDLKGSTRKRKRVCGNWYQFVITFSKRMGGYIVFACRADQQSDPFIEAFIRRTSSWVYASRSRVARFIDTFAKCNQELLAPSLF